MNTTLYFYTLQTKQNKKQNKTKQNKKNTSKRIYSYKMVTKWPIFILRHFDFGENLKKKYFESQEILLKLKLEIFIPVGF